jgi:hypothetical protein
MNGAGSFLFNEINWNPEAVLIGKGEDFGFKFIQVLLLGGYAKIPNNFHGSVLRW